MSASLAAFQDAFAQALLHPHLADEAVASLVAQPTFAVYRNTVLKGCVDALAAGYPSVCRLVGTDWFRGAAADFARLHPPQRAMLIDYGVAFVEALAASEPGADLPYLAGVARLDRAWTESHAAADATPVAPDAVARLAPADFVRTRLVPHPAARWAWFESLPVVTIWSCTRVGTAVPAELEWRGEGVLITRPRDVVEWIALDRAGCAFMSACGAGRTVADAAMSAVIADPGVDLAALMARTLTCGAFGALEREG